MVEDEEESWQALMQLLELEGFKVVGASNGAEAMDYLSVAELPCLIILDLLMPVMSGRQLRAALLQAPDLAIIPVVVVSAIDGSAVADLRVVRAFRKPLDIDASVGVIRKHC